MAALTAEHDVLVMPSNSQYRHETFGIVSIEAQHASCRVVASDDGGLPETGCGALVLVPPDDPHALAHGPREAVALGVVDAVRGAVPGSASPSPSRSTSSSTCSLGLGPEKRAAKQAKRADAAAPHRGGGGHQGPPRLTDHNPIPP